MIDPGALWRRALAPEREFRRLAAEGDLRLGPSLGRLMLLRTPVAVLDSVLIYLSLSRLYDTFRLMKGPVWEAVFQAVPQELSVEDIRSMLAELPAMPDLGRAFPWLLLLAPLFVIGLWMHNAFWDHGCLWLLRGVTRTGGLHKTCVAESEALQVGVIGALLGLLTHVPVVGWILAIPVGMVNTYFWVMRGFALAAYHGCPVWKGLVATILHVVLAVLLFGGVLVLMLLLLGQGLA